MTCRECDFFYSCKEKNDTYFNVKHSNFTASVEKVCSSFRPIKTSDNFKFDNGKPRLDLVMPALIRAVGEVRTYGIKKYGSEDSYKKVEVWRYKAAFMRHVTAWLEDPYGVDEESGLPHLWHALCNGGFIVELDKPKEGASDD